MKRTRKRGWRELIVLVVALVCGGTWAAGQVRSMSDRSEVAKMMEKMKTVCVGRFLVDVPAEAAIAISHEMITGFEIETVDEDESTFREHLVTREVEIEARGLKSANDGGGGMVQARDLRISGMVGRVFIYGHSRGYMMEGNRRVDMESVSVEVHAHSHGRSFSLSAKSTDQESAKEAEQLIERLQLREEYEVPATTGFCIARAVFADPLPPHTTEHVTMSMAMPGHPDLAIVLSIMPGGARGPNLLERVSQTDGLTSAEDMLRVTKLRTRKRNVNGILGEESLERVREMNFTTGFAFLWETQGTEGNVLDPFLALELQTGSNPIPGGKPVDSSLHEDAVLALWDNISSTIRLRKSEPPPPASAPQPAGPKLGTTTRAGDTCPQSGWWECSAGGDGLRVHGGQVQFLREGERIPQALLLPPQTLWQKFRGVQPSIEPDHLTVWQLVDKRSRPRIPPTVALAPAGAGAAALDLQNGVGRGRGGAVGSYLRTGDACSASGWWRCEESHSLDGTRWFAAGNLLPAATFRVPPGVFGRTAGPEVIQRRSTWQLLRAAEAPTDLQHSNGVKPTNASSLIPTSNDPKNLA